MDEHSRTTDPQDGSGTPPTESTRRYGATRVRPRVEFGRREPTAEPPPREASSEGPLTPEVLDRDPGSEAGGGQGYPFGGGDLFGGREFAGGRVRVYGCSPGCLMISLAVSVILTLLLNAIF